MRALIRTFVVLIAVACAAAAQAAEPPALALDAGAAARLEAAAEAYRRIDSEGGWPALADGPALRAGDTDPRAAALRRALATLGDLAADAAGDPRTVTAEIAAAVVRFQARHGLAADGVVGRDTRAALNVPAAERARALALNAGRLRALAPRIPRRAVVVNIPAFALALLADGRAEFAARVIVGLPSWRTPTLESAIDRIEVNPDWNVPRSIARRELAPKIAADPGYLARHDMRVLAGPPGAAREVAPEEVDWSRFAASGLRLRQDPGPDNPLGAVAFRFPNPYDVYLHDTPAKSLFRGDARALSHGCVRVEDAFALAVRLFADDPRWTEDRLRAEIATGRNVWIALAVPIPVHLVYVTAWVEPDGTVQFRRDIYRRDAAERPATAEPCGAPAAPGEAPRG